MNELDDWESYAKEKQGKRRGRDPIPTEDKAVSREFHGRAVTFDRTAARHPGRVERQYQK